ncbi:MAG: glycerophosphodiester phosphodiesterase [Oscillospiraceae bacterium]|jgi:glycerophosphoryl diester phosphodiesterase|nr:glycerophosphodiester phosphodiesterase [Oscillospiraceae bacterium]
MIWLLICLGIGVILLVALIYCIAPGKMTPEAKKVAQIFYGLNCAHRGLHTENQQVPENSIPAFEAARNGNYGVELDIQLTKDEQVVVFHDVDLKRACGVDELINNKSWEELCAFSLFGTRERIPLLTDTLEILGDTPVIVELKSTGANIKKLCEETLKIMREKGRRWCVESFDPRIGKWFRENAPDVLRGQLGCRPDEYTGITKGQAFLLGNMLTNFMSRPHFIAYNNTLRPLTVKLCNVMKPMKVIWTIKPDGNIEKYERENDAIIFEYYKPAPKYRS